MTLSDVLRPFHEGVTRWFFVTNTPPSPNPEEVICLLANPFTKGWSYPVRYHLVGFKRPVLHGPGRLPVPSLAEQPLAAPFSSYFPTGVEYKLAESGLSWVLSPSVLARRHVF